MNYLNIDPDSPIGQRFKELSEDPRVSDFYLTANEPLAYKVNGELIYDTVVHEVQVPEHIEHLVAGGTVLDRSLDMEGDAIVAAHGHPDRQRDQLLGLGVERPGREG